MKINLDSVTAQSWFKAVTQVTNEINYTVMKDYRQRNSPLKLIANASELYVPGIKDKIFKTSDTFKEWSDLDLLNNKDGWDNLEIAKGTLLSGLYTQLDAEEDSEQPFAKTCHGKSAI
jgi:hypothetical protein